MSQEGPVELKDFEVSKVEQVIAITTPIPGPDGTTSKKTPVFHLPIYKISLYLKDQEKPVTFHCDLADITDLTSKLKSCINFRIRYGNKML